MCGETGREYDETDAVATSSACMGCEREVANRASLLQILITGNDHLLMVFCDVINYRVFKSDGQCVCGVG